ncbi:hypothetical protein [Candidatus Accumulibacter sp. ACC003]|uniref:hypothetical protein n=1 Tax=Candidatus Accumulibacter sp. ACC003 TaxID=2823334 RepID=UPI0025C69111|nr:hypothetical protein [Candidatus Accumulibacter sp. ACC003]
MRFAAWLVALLLLPLLAIALLLASTLEAAPLVSRSASISPTSIADAKSLLASNDPRRLRRGEQRTALIPAALIDEALNHLSSRVLQGRGAFALAKESAEVRLSVAAPRLLAAPYLNLSVLFKVVDGQPRIASASLGALPIPPGVAEWLIALAIEYSGLGADWHLARQAFRGLQFAPARGLVAVSYAWEPGLLESARSRAFTPTEIADIEAAQRALAALLADYPARARVPLSKILAPLLSRVGKRTLQDDRAALLVLAAYLSEKRLSTLLPAARQWPQARPLELTLHGHYDKAQHFTISAALAAWAGEPAANAIGIYKEIDDSRGGSGFSFADLAADRAGTRFGELIAADSPRLQAARRSSLADAELAPALGGLPEDLSEATFQRRFGGPDNAAFQELSREIDHRLAALPLYR